MGASRSHRKMAKKAASQCRRDSEAVRAQERGSMDKRPRGWGAWSCCFAVSRRGRCLAQPHSACTPAAQKQFTSGEPPAPAWSPFDLPTCF